MQLYDELAVQKRAYYVHAGWVGLDAAKTNVVKIRCAAYKVREESNRTQKLPKKEKKPMLPKTPKEKEEAPIHDQQGNDGQDKDTSDWEVYFDDNYGEGPSNQFGNM